MHSIRIKEKARKEARILPSCISDVIVSVILPTEDGNALKEFTEDCFTFGSEVQSTSTRRRFRYAVASFTTGPRMHEFKLEGSRIKKMSVQCCVRVQAARSPDA